MFDNEWRNKFFAEYYFGDYCLKFNEVLLKNGRVIPIPPKELHILSLLAANAGRLLSKEFLIKTVWNGGIVSDESLTRCIYSLRKILEKNGDSGYIETIYGKGYAFASEISLTPCVKHNTQEMLAVFPCGKFSDLAFVDVYEIFSESLPVDVNIYPYALLSKCKNPEDFQMFIKHHNPKYVVYYTLTDVDHNERIINFSIENRMADEAVAWLTVDVTQLKERNYTYFKHRIQRYLKPKFSNDDGQQVFEQTSFTEKNHLHHSLVNYLIDDYSHSSLTTTVNVLLKNANCMNHHVDGVIKLAECYLGFILSGDSNVYKLIYKIKKIIDSLLLVEPLNARVLALMGVVKGIDKEDEHSHHCFSQANYLAPNDDFVIYYYALHFFFKGQYGLFLDEVQKLSHSSAFNGRVQFLKHKIHAQQLGGDGDSGKKLCQISADSMAIDDVSDETYHVYAKDKRNTLRGRHKQLLNARLNELKEISYHPLRIRNSIDWM